MALPWALSAEQQRSSLVRNYVRLGLLRTESPRVAWVRRMPGDPRRLAARVNWH